MRVLFRSACPAQSSRVDTYSDTVLVIGMVATRSLISYVLSLCVCVLAAPAENKKTGGETQTNKQTNKQRKTRRGDAGELQKAEAKLDDVNGRPSIVNHLILIRVIILLS